MAVGLNDFTNVGQMWVKIADSTESGYGSATPYAERRPASPAKLWTGTSRGSLEEAEKKKTSSDEQKNSGGKNVYLSLLFIKLRVSQSFYNTSRHNNKLHKN